MRTIPVERNIIMSTILIAIAIIAFAIGFYVLLAAYAIVCFAVTTVFNIVRFGFVEGKKKVHKIYAHK